MKTFNHFYESPKRFSDYLEDIGLDKEQTLLVRIHSTLHNMEEIIPVAEDVQNHLPGAVIIGCSTTGVICEGKIYENACLVSITETEHCRLRLGMFSCVTEDGAEKDAAVLAREVSEELVCGEPGMLLSFFPLSYYKTAKFTKCMNDENEGLIMAGGVSYRNGDAHHEANLYSYVLGGTQPSHSAMVGVMIVSSELHIYENVINGVENVGRSYEVTKVHDHFLDEIEHMDAATWYEEMLGREHLEKDPGLAGIFPLIKEGTRQTYNLVYEPYGILPEPWHSQKRNRLNLFSEIPEGTHVSLGYFDPHKIVKQLNEVYHDLQEQPVEVIFGYDCLARMWMLHDCATWEIEQFYTTNMSGAMLAGELSSADGKNMYSNSTFVVTGLSEHADAHMILKEKELKNVSALQHDNVQMINYLLTIGNKQLNRQLGEQQNKMKQAMFYNEGLALNNQSKYLYDNENQKLNKAAVFSLRNERILKLFLGRTELQEELKTLYRDAGKGLPQQSFLLYSYGEHSLLVAAGDAIGEEAFTEAMHTLFDTLNSIVRKDIAFSYECAIAFYDEDPLQKLEEALHYGEEHKVPFVVYNEIPEALDTVMKDMHMLQVIKDALVEDRVTPYFQGIHDNRENRINMYEALIRIKDAQGKLYFPDQFLALSKEYNLYEALSVRMVSKVMEMFLNKNIRVTINLNVQDLYDREIIRTIFKYLDQEKHPENFVFELLESEEVQDYKYIKQFADSIHEYGAKIAIDDFGSGFSNIIHVMQINADIIKIDGEIIKDICNDSSCQEFLEMIQGWCSRRNKSVIAEYVENSCIQHIMEEIGITYSQGYHYAKPMPWEECLQQVS